ncbi:class I SAM-dependent methyltransferase [Candidatus Chloroploca mongolica]|uniref:class I SAM-dependent methyltransferase n=1 Tax=Candidatus Chloroploca mongolica TaxID=2528176 RepID=UPI0035308270
MLLYRQVVRWAFHVLYHEFAWSYDFVAALVSRGYWQRWTAAALPELQGVTLELGAGPGHMQLALANRAATFGLDRSPTMLALAARRVRRAGATPRLMRADAAALPVCSAACATVFATFPSEYIVDPATQAEIRRVLMPGGRLVLVPFAELDAGWYQRLMALAYRLTLQFRPRADHPSDQGVSLTGSPAGTPERLELAGMVLYGRWVRVGASRVMVMVGTHGQEAYGTDL